MPNDGPTQNGLALLSLRTKINYCKIICAFLSQHKKLSVAYQVFVVRISSAKINNRISSLNATMAM